MFRGNDFYSRQHFNSARKNMSYSLPPRPEFYIPDVMVRAREEETTALKSKRKPSTVFSKAKVGLRKAKARATAAATIAAHEIGTKRMRKVASQQKHRQKHRDLSIVKQRIEESVKITGSREEAKRAFPNSLLPSSSVSIRITGRSTD